MDDPSESLDLSQLHLTPDWVKQDTESNKYADYKGESKGSRRDGKSGRGGRGDFGGGQGRGPRRPDGDRKPVGDRRGGGGPRPPGAGQGQRPGQGQGQGQRGGQGQGQGPGRRPGGERGRSGGRDNRGGSVRGRGRDHRDHDREPLPTGIEIRFIAEGAGVESLARQIKATGRAYSVFDLAKLVLSARERYAVEFFKGQEAGDNISLFQCKLDGSLWLSPEDALRHALSTDRFAEFYSAEEIETDPPRGNFSVVAVCGMSGVVLGPPNHHDYQKDLNRLYQERFSNMHFEGYKRRIRMENDPETIEKWKAQKSRQTHFTYQKTPEGTEPVVLKSREEMERHCREHHLDDLVAAVDKARVPGNIPAKAMAPVLLAVLRRELDQQKRFPMNTVKVLCRQLEEQGLKFFKDEDDKHKKTTYVCRSRPRALQGVSHFSERIRKIVGLVRDNPGIDYSIVVSSMLPGQKISAATAKAGKQPAPPAQAAAPPEEQPAAPEQPVAPQQPTVPEQPAPSPAVAADSPAPAQPNTVVEPPPAATIEEATAPETVAAQTAVDSESSSSSEVAAAPAEEAARQAPTTEAPAESGQPSSSPAPPVEPDAAPEVEGPSEEEIGILKDLRWLIREGYVVEYSSGAMRLARNHPVRKRPARKKKPAATSQPKPPATASNVSPAPELKSATEPPPAGDAAIETESAPATGAPPEDQPAAPAPAAETTTAPEAAPAIDAPRQGDSGSRSEPDQSAP